LFTSYSLSIIHLALRTGCCFLGFHFQWHLECKIWFSVSVSLYWSVILEHLSVFRAIIVMWSKMFTGRESLMLLW
jgi:hypothetical protein